MTERRVEKNLNLGNRIKDRVKAVFDYFGFPEDVEARDMFACADGKIDKVLPTISKDFEIEDGPEPGDGEP